jgi:hypothetical protein
MLSALKIGCPLYLATFFLYGCAIADFEPYSGQQQNWPTSPGTFVNTTYVVPTYFGYPPRPYNVIGYLDATTAPIRHRGVVAFAGRIVTGNGKARSSVRCVAYGQLSGRLPECWLTGG